MSRLSWTKRFYWRYLSKPASERSLFLHVLENPYPPFLKSDWEMANDSLGLSRCAPSRKAYRKFDTPVSMRSNQPRLVHLTCH